MPRPRGLIAAADDVRIVYGAVHHDSIVINRCHSSVFDWPRSGFLIVNLLAVALKRASILEKNGKDMTVSVPGDFAVLADISIWRTHACVGHIYGGRANEFHLDIRSLILAATSWQGENREQ